MGKKPLTTPDRPISETTKKPAGTDKKENPHAGHRQRIREEYCKGGLSHFAYHEVLEMLLYYAIPRVDTNPIAHRLMDTFGSFYQVFSASIDALCAVKGMTYNAAVLIHMVPDICQRIFEDEMDKQWVLNTDELVGEYLVKCFRGHTSETVLLLCMSNNCRLIKNITLSVGTGAFASINIRKLCEEVFHCGCHHIILAHNHPTGNSRPSAADIRSTEYLHDILKPMDIDLLDHFIICGDKYVSMTQLGYLNRTPVINR